MAKKDVKEFVNDLLDGSVNGSSIENFESVQTALDAINANYEFTDEELHAELRLQKDRLEQSIGFELTPEQLEALCGGKQKVTLDGGGLSGAAAGGIAAGVTGGVVGGAAIGATLAVILIGYIK